MENLLAIVGAPLSMLCCCKKSIQYKWRKLVCRFKWCPLYLKEKRGGKSNDLENGHLKTTKMTDEAENFHQIGQEPSHWASR